MATFNLNTAVVTMLAMTMGESGGLAPIPRPMRTAVEDKSIAQAHAQKITKAQQRRLRKRAFQINQQTRAA